MKAKIKELWLMVECPHCLRPFNKNKFTHDNTVVFKPMTVNCEYCDRAFVIDLKVHNESMDPR